MSRRPPSSAGNPYKVLIWMGAAVALLFAGVLALVMLRPSPGPYLPPEHERTLLWMYDDAASGKAASAAVIEESRARGTLTAVTFPAPEEAAELFVRGQSGRKVQDFLQGKLQRRLHHRVFLTYSVVARLIDAADGIPLAGKTVYGAEALAYLRTGGPDASERATAVLFALSRAVSVNGVSIGISEGLSLARQVDTDFELTALPDVLARWSRYTSPTVHAVPQGNLAAVADRLEPDRLQPEPDRLQPDRLEPDPLQPEPPAPAPAPAR